ncbi:MAG: restriction endonuclease subunit S [Gaiellales bacterium]
MSEWPTKTLGEICREGDGFIRTGPFGSQLHRSDYTDDPNGIPVVMPKDMARGRIDTASIARIDDETADRLKQHLLSANDLVLARRGDVGRTAWVFEEDLPAFCGTGSMRVHPGKSESVRPSFLRFFFQTKLASDYLEGHAVGATMPNLNAGIVESLPVPIPPLPNQDSLIPVLEAFDELIENNRRRVEVLEEMARVIYREWFVKFRYPGHDAVPLVDSALGPIPQGWGTRRLREYVSTQYGYTESASTTRVGPKYLRGMDINKASFIDWSKVPFCPIEEVAAEKFRIRLGDVFVIRMADPGKVGICEEDVDAVFASYLVRLRPLSELLRPYYLFFTLSDSEYQGWITGASTGATRKSVSAKVMTEPCVVLPPAALQLQFESVIGPIRANMSTLVNKNAKLSELRDLLLPKLVTGQIDVSTLDLDALVSTGSTDVELGSTAGVGVA